MVVDHDIRYPVRSKGVVAGPGLGVDQRDAVIRAPPDPGERHKIEVQHANLSNDLSLLR